VTYTQGALHNISSSTESLIKFKVYLPLSVSKVLKRGEVDVCVERVQASYDQVSLLSVYRALLNQCPGVESLLPINDRLKLVGYQLVVNGKGYMDMSMYVAAVACEISVRKVFAGG
jgi:hypothetical protein